MHILVTQLQNQKQLTLNGGDKAIYLYLKIIYVNTNQYLIFQCIIMGSYAFSIFCFSLPCYRAVSVGMDSCGGVIMDFSKFSLSYLG